jgi:cellulose synthase/poly-beta-1,6-N-acetylglucosamine synthase-like glycosyltransferase
MTIEASLFIAVTLLYVGQCCLFMYGISKARYKKNLRYEPTVSVVAAARDEEMNIRACLESLALLDYPEEKLEIIVVDDNSTDATPALIRECVKKHSHIKTFTAKQDTDRIRGKANAIAQGIDISSGEIILMTDADCTVLPSWVRSTVQNYSNDTGIVAGLTLLRPKNWFAGIQSLDWTYILAVASAAMALKNPLSCIGNNFSFRRKAYDEVGGYRGIKFSVTEDFALFKAITQSGKWGYRYPLEKEALVFSNACRTIWELYRQKRRWGVGGKDMPISGFMIMAVAFSMHVFLLSGFFLDIGLTLLLSGLAMKLICDLILLGVPLARTEQTSQLKYFSVFELYYIIYVILLPFAVFLGGKVVWKGRKY